MRPTVGQAGNAQSVYHDTMVEQDKQVGQILDLIDELGIADDTIVMYSTDNGPHKNTWPDAGTSPFRHEKNSGWEGAFRVPSMVRWPGRIKADSVSNQIMSHLDWVPTLLSAAGAPDVKENLLKGDRAAGRKYKVLLDGYDFLPYLTGEAKEAPRKEFFYFSGDGDPLALRYNNRKVHFMVQDQPGTLEVWQRELRGLRLPLMFNLRTDPFEQATITSNAYWDWTLDHPWIPYPLPDVVGRFLGTFEDFPPRHAAASFTVGDAMEILEQGAGRYGELGGFTPQRRANRSPCSGPCRLAGRAPISWEALVVAALRGVGSRAREGRHA